MTDDTLAARKDKLNATLRLINSAEIEDDSNFKFMNLLRSRLGEEGIPIEHATQIVANLDYDLSPVNEDDDYIGDVALAYAEFAGKVYGRLKSYGWTRSFTDSLVRKYFNVFKVTL